VICAEASGCHGHNGADGVAAETAPIAKTIDKPVRLQWTPAEGHGWEPLGLAMVQDMRGGVTGSSVVAWEHEMCGATHHSRPSAGNSAGDLQGATRVAALPLTWVLPRTPALRSLGGFSDSFAYESFMDELAKKANADSRAQDVVDAAVAQSGRGGPPPGAPTGFARGRGIAFRRCETVEACVAVVAEVMVNAATGAVQVTRVVVAHGYGQIIDPDGLKNQIEGNLIQGISRP
jgi:CO/xanthine dehydrogenase Mo-binding subunit